MTWGCPSGRAVVNRRMSPVGNCRSEDQGIRFLHPARTDRFGRDTQDEPNHDIEASDREEEETRAEGELADVV